MTSMKISTTGELLTVLPHQLGHHLEKCVVIAMVTDNVVGPVARTDLPAECDLAETAEHLLESLLRVAPRLALLVGYESVVGESCPMLDALHEGLRHAGVGVIDQVVVRDGRWWGACCRPPASLGGHPGDHLDGHPMIDEASVPAVTELITRGSAPLASRGAVSQLVTEDRAASQAVGDILDDLWDELLGRVDPDGVLELDPTSSALEELGLTEKDVELARERAAQCLEKLDRVPALWSRVFAPVGGRGEVFTAGDEEVARMVQSLLCKPWRDSLIAWMSPVMFPLDQVDEVSRRALESAVPGGPVTSCEESATVLRRLLQLARRVPDEWGEAAAICTVAACVAWGIGNGATAGDAVTRALRVEPGYRLAAYLGQMIEHQLRPRQQWGDLAA